jgi:hypothetical protein
LVDDLGVAFGVGLGLDVTRAHASSSLANL